MAIAVCLCLLFAGSASAQWVVSDPGNLAQGIINASKNIVHTSKTATNMVNNFQETVKIYQQGWINGISCSPARSTTISICTSTAFARVSTCW